jgi:hypothetical protein
MLSQDLINVMIGVALSVIGWFARQMWDAVNSLKKDLGDLEVKLPTEYIRKDEFNDRWIEVLSSLRRIEDKLEDKVNRNEMPPR